MVACREMGGGGETKERSNVAGAKYNNSWRGVGRQKVCDTIRPSVHRSIGGNFRKHQIKHIEQTTAKVAQHLS